MSALNSMLAAATAAPHRLAAAELGALLAEDDPSVWAKVFAAAREVRRRTGRDAVLPRGLIETSNVCAKNCCYCGIRAGQRGVERYRLQEAEVELALAEARRRGYPAVAFQGGEIESEENTAYYERLLARCRGLEVTLSLGEQTEAVYRRWRQAGALRYLIRIETSDRGLFAALHPAPADFDRRLGCIRMLKRLGYITGSGVMIGLPGQSPAMLAEDLEFFAAERLDMVGMGPFIPAPGTPLASAAVPSPARRVQLTLRMIALTRLLLHEVNIVSATALEALAPDGRQQGLDAGANVIMPNLTPPRARAAYALYPGKPGAD